MEWGFGVSESKKNLDPNDPSYYAPPRARERGSVLPPPENERPPSLPAQRRPDDPFSNLRADTQSDAFAQAVAKMLREQREAELAEAPRMLQRRSSLHLAGKLAGAIASAALVALLYVEVFSSSEDRLGLASLLRPRETITTSPAPQRRASTLVVRNHSGLANDPLELGVSVDAPDPGATVTVRGMPAEARLTAGTPVSLSEWRIPAEQISEARVIPPTDFVGEMDLSAELHNSDGAALVTSFLQLTWRAVSAAAAPLITSTVTASAVPAPQPLSQPLSPPMSLPPAVAVTSPPQPQAEATREPSPNEISGFVRRAQELLATGDIRAARTILLRAAGAHDARAALFLAKTFDPIALRQLSTSDPGPDLEQARIWYQRAREWGSPEAQHQLDALASFR